MPPSQQIMPRRLILPTIPPPNVMPRTLVEAEITAWAIGQLLQHCSYFLCFRYDPNRRILTPLFGWKLINKQEGEQDHSVFHHFEDEALKFTKRPHAHRAPFLQCQEKDTCCLVHNMKIKGHINEDQLTSNATLEKERYTHGCQL